jgi:hypothetical protein
LKVIEAEPTEKRIAQLESSLQQERETARELLEALEAVNALTMDHFNLRPIAGRRMSNADQDLIDKTFDLVEAAIAKAGEKGAE